MYCTARGCRGSADHLPPERYPKALDEKILAALAQHLIVGVIRKEE
jgi:hypothetical protein